MSFYLISILFTIYCIVHVVKTGRSTIWIYVMLMLPDIGAAAYFVSEILPEWMNGSRTNRLARNAWNRIDPTRNARRRALDLEIADTADNKRLLAEEFIHLCRFDEAVELYKGALVGVHADDPTLLLGLARAEFGRGQHAEALTALDHLRAANPDFESASGHLLYAKSLEQIGEIERAIEEYRALAGYATGEEARCRLALLLQKQGDIDAAREIFREILTRTRLANRRYRRAESEWIELARRFVPAG